MTTRTHRLFGKAWANNPAEAIIKFNNVEVYNGAVATTPDTPDINVDWADLQDLCEWTSDSVNGSIPLEITPVGAWILLTSVKMNNIRAQLSESIKPGAVWAGYVPASVAEVQEDKREFTTNENNLAPITAETTALSSKYSMTWAQVENNLETTVVVASSDNFVIPAWGFNSITDAKLNGAPVEASPATDDEAGGQWYYLIAPGSTFTCNLQVPIGK
jgi:hypothetical protein